MRTCVGEHMLWLRISDSSYGHTERVPVVVVAITEKRVKVRVVPQFGRYIAKQSAVGIVRHVLATSLTRLGEWATP